MLLTRQRASLRAVDELLEDRAPDREVVAMAQRIARRLVDPAPAPRPAGRARVSGKLASVPYRYRSDDIDLDRTIEVLTERPVPEDTDIVVRERMRSRRAVVLVVDVSGSMRGEKVRMAAATVAALSADLADDQLAVVAFWSDAALLTPLEEPVPAARLLDLLLRIPARGLTNVHFALTVAQAELARSAARRRSAVLLTRRRAQRRAGPARWSRAASPSCTCCCRPTASTTPRSAPTSPGSATAGSPRSRPTATWRPRSTGCWPGRPPRASRHVPAGESRFPAHDCGRRVVIASTWLR